MCGRMYPCAGHLEESDEMKLARQWHHSVILPKERLAGARGHAGVGSRPTLIASCDQRGSAGSWLQLPSLVGVNRRGARTMAPQMSAFQQWAVLITVLSFHGVTHLECIHVHRAWRIKRKINKLSVWCEFTKRGLIHSECQIKLDSLETRVKWSTLSFRVIYTSFTVNGLASKRWFVTLFGKVISTATQEGEENLRDENSRRRRIQGKNTRKMEKKKEKKLKATP